MNRNCSESKKDQIIDVAAKLFFCQGYNATGIKQIIDEAGIAKGTFYCHFKSKEELGLAWLKRRHNDWSRWRQEEIARPGTTPKEQLLALFTSLEEWMRKSDFRGCPFINTLTETPDADSPMRAEIKNHKQGMVDFILQRVEQIFPEKDPEEQLHLSRIVFLLFEAAMIESQNFREFWPIDTARKQVAQAIGATLH
ncbi:TetR/AcrR family transcriptional regulator [Pelagicoccus sp. SDUM812003]|uniref:TetR/AcrR family transcriptional regulator n=1 Tax=Pelagicoccus sp. SDUM812003 TaxID=3041267 RepID=UPI00281028C4|nr:TetR/AcrR family transcriptional regulator [Pelagicoccus sp. SDUM812003]MDQ8202492.1 TetR/AcrR family transcriptional regulator [Pelagicoccus sp. SDUM812003]